MVTHSKNFFLFPRFLILFCKFKLYSTMHYKCRNASYGNDKHVKRSLVPDDKVHWDQKWDEYDPPYYTAKGVIGKPWADKDIDDPGFSPTWNALDDTLHVDRQSFMGVYRIVDGLPLNPMGRTGLRGRGVLGKWGPNHAADPIVTRWKREPNNTIIKHQISGNPILQFVCIKRKDNNEWAFPGGMVDPGEIVSQTLKREFLEETMNSLEMDVHTKSQTEKHLKDFFTNGEDVYKGYVDDPRNTDNSWIETVAKHFHDQDGTFVGTLNFNAGDDAIGVSWKDVANDLKLYASHSQMLHKVAQSLKAHW